MVVHKKYLIREGGGDVVDIGKFNDSFNGR